MFQRRSPRQLILLAALSLVIAALLVSCASTSAGGNDAQLGLKGVAAAPAAPSAADSSRTAGGAMAQAGFITAQQRIVKTGQVTLEVESVANGLSQVRAMAVDLGGYVGGSQAGTLDQSATLTLRIPAARFDEALSRLHEIGNKVLAESTQEEDVTSSLVDLQARLENLQASEAQYRVLVGRATKIEDILAVQSRLDDVQGQIEQISAQLKSLGNQADLSTLTVTLTPRAQPIQAASSTWDPGETVGSAVGALLQLGQGLATFGIWLGIVGLPILVVLALLMVLLLRLGILRRPRSVSGAGTEA
ncbi:MAG TPA: DUF4349 domain-containing protein [Candidatus Limnocylindria bacterium]|nr:DUF4349 domain-containing protein [Candidatus Limnocylindria bacterium]